MEEGKRKKELDRFYLSLFTFDEIILRGLTAVKVRPFSGSVNRKKIVDSAKLDQARGAWPRSVERNRNRKPIWRITSGSVSRLPFCLTDLFMLPPSVQCFFFASSSSSLSLSRRNGIWKRVHLLRDWNLQCVIHFYISSLNYSKYLKLVERFS